LLSPPKSSSLTLINTSILLISLISEDKSCSLPNTVVPILNNKIKTKKIYRIHNKF
jgi:hypothetical protein